MVLYVIIPIKYELICDNECHHFALVYTNDQELSFYLDNVVCFTKLMSLIHNNVWTDLCNMSEVIFVDDLIF